MNTAKTAIMAMIVAFVAMISMTGFAMAGSTTQTYVGDGTYTTSWNGNGGTMNIDTYTSNGNDHLFVDYKKGHTNGYQTGSTNGWTVITRNVNTDGKKTSVSATTIDKSLDVVVIDVMAKKGGTGLYQTVSMNDGTYDAVVSTHAVGCGGKKYDVSVYTRSGTAYTVVDISGKHGGGGIVGAAGSLSGPSLVATGQFIYYAGAGGNGVGVIVGSGDSVSENLQVTNDGTSYPSSANGETYVELYDDFNYHYSATGYVYAIDY